MSANGHEHLCREFMETVGKFGFQIGSGGYFDDKLFSEIKELARPVLKANKSNTHLPKNMLSEIYATINIIENDKAYINAPADKIEEALDKLNAIFEMLIISEIYDDRIPGTPRII